MAKIQIIGLDEAMRLVDATKAQRVFNTISMAVAAEAQTRIAAYPSASRKKQPFGSAKQRRAFFARLRAGEIEVPYRRGSSPGSEGLGRRWRITQRGVGAVLENSASYAGLVHGAETQAPYHRGTWTTDEKLADQIEADGTVARIATLIIAKEFS